jgi:hypothetical protein
MMATTEEIIKKIDLISNLLFETSLNDETFDTLKKTSAQLSAQIAVHYSLQATVTHLLGPESSTPLLNTQGRLSKFLDVLYSCEENSASPALMQ